MHKITHGNEIDDPEFESRIDAAVQILRSKCRLSERDAVFTLVHALAFKYWQENVSLELNSAVESFDSDYVQLHWNQFCNSEIGKSIGLLKYDEYDEGVIAACLGIVAEYITRHNFDSVNADVIERWFKSHYNAIVDGGLDKKVKALIKVYRRGKEDLSANPAELDKENL